MNYKGFAATLLIAVMLITAVPFTFAGTFPDVTDKHSWAEEYIEDMVGRGLLKGYTDGTFKPDNPISKMEAVILASRILGVTKDENSEYAEAAINAFAQELSDYDTQYKKEVAYLLYWGALNLSELPSYIGNDIKNTAMKRYEVAVLLTKVMGGEKEAENNTMVVLDYSDDSQVPASSKAYVHYISSQGIMNGMENNLFMPMGEVTRAMMAALMHRTEQAMDMESVNANVISVSPSDNKFEAAIEGDSAGTVFELSSDILVNVDGVPSDISKIKPGYDITIHYQGEGIRMLEALSTKSSGETSGVIYTVSNINGVRSVSVTPTGADGENYTTYSLSNDCVIVIDNTETIFTSLKKGNYVKMSIQNGVVKKITAETKELKYNGTITDIDLTGEGPAISIKLKDGTVNDYQLMGNAVIIRNNVADEIRNLAIGDSVEIIVTAGRIKKITATSVNKDIDGTIEEIVISSTPSITIKSNGVSTKYYVAAGTEFYVEDKAGTIYDMRLGAAADVTLKSENIDKIKISENDVPSQLIGTVTSVNPLYNVLTIDIVEASGTITSTTVVVKSTVKIIDNTKTKISALKGITAGRSIIALGALDNYGTYSVSTIIITQ